MKSVLTISESELRDIVASVLQSNRINADVDSVRFESVEGTLQAIVEVAQQPLSVRCRPEDSLTSTMLSRYQNQLMSAYEIPTDSQQAQ